MVVSQLTGPYTHLEARRIRRREGSFSNVAPEPALTVVNKSRQSRAGGGHHLSFELSVWSLERICTMRGGAQ